MTRAFYVIGGAGVGKSTFMSSLLDDQMSVTYGPLVDLCQRPNARGSTITLRGHQLRDEADESWGTYLGVHRAEFPGSDGLDRVSGIAGERWCDLGDLPDRIVGEGSTLATRRFLGALQRTTDLMVVHLVADPALTRQRCEARGAGQDERFVLGTATRARNLAAWCDEEGMLVFTLDAGDPDAVELALDLGLAHLQ